MRTKLLAIMACTFVQSFGQSFQLGPNMFTNRVSLRAIELVPGGDYIATGSFRPAASNPDQAFIARVSPSLGSVVWAKVFEPNTIFWFSYKTSNNEYVVSGQYIGSHGFVCRFNSAGVMLWRTDLSSVTDLRCVAESADGNIWAGGTIGKELLVCFDSAGALIWAKAPPTGVGSLITRIIPDATGMSVFGSETHIPDAFNLQASVRRFDLLGNELLHTVVGNSSGASESLHDVLRLPSGEYIIATQYINNVAIRQEMGLIRLDPALSYMPAMTRAYMITGNSMVSPRIVADASSIYALCTKTLLTDGGTIVTKISLPTGTLQSTNSVARGFSRVNRVLWRAGNLVLPSCQDLVLSVGNPPELLADIAEVSPVTLERVTPPCENVTPPPVIEETTYYGGVSATVVTPVDWDNLSVTSSSGIQPTALTLAYYDCNFTLPVELTSFTGEAVGDVTELVWTTASERGSDYFDIERSSDGITFVYVGRVESVGESQATVRYEFTDYDPLSGTSYYRLRQVDEDGAFEFSDMVSVRFDHLHTGPFEFYDMSLKRVPDGQRLSPGMYLRVSPNGGGVVKRVYVE